MLKTSEEVEYPSLSCVRLFTFSEQLYVVESLNYIKKSLLFIRGFFCFVFWGIFCFLLLCFLFFVFGLLLILRRHDCQGKDARPMLSTYGL